VARLRSIRHSTVRRGALAAALTAAAITAGAGAPPAGQASISAKRAEAERLRAAVAAETARINATTAGLADAQARLAMLDARAQKRTTQTIEAQNRLVRARVRLTRLEHRAERATRLLSANLVANYKAGEPNVVSVVMDSNGFADLLERVRFYRKVANNNARVLDATREARREVAGETVRLDKLRLRFSALAKQAIADRDQADVIRNALLRRQAEQLQDRAGTSARLVAVRNDIDALERRQAIAAAAARRAATATQQAPPTDTSPAPSSGGGGGGGGPTNVSGTIARVVAAANQIASTPYVWGGGHGGASGGYDCSGSVSYALAAGGLLSSPLDSTGFMSWGAPGPGQHITVYANAGHAFMIVDGRRFDTSALSGGGTRWTSAGRSTAGFVARHPPGY
jgi:cell wall-associated NlpC family hydrolase